MTLLAIDGFGDQATGSVVPVGWAGSAGTIGAATGRFGSAGFYGPGGANTYIQRAFTPSAVGIFGLAIYPTLDSQFGYAAGSIQLLGDNGNTCHMTVGRNLGGTLSLMRGGGNGTLMASSSLILSLNTWSYIEIKATINDSGGICIVKVNGVEFINYTGDTRNGGTSTNLDAFRLGSTQWNAYFDDIYICNGLGSTNNDFLGDSRVVELYPNANGAYSQGVGSDTNSTDNYQLVDEPGAPVTTDYVDLSAGNGDSYGYTDLSVTSGTVRGVHIKTYAQKTDTGTVGMYNTSRLGGIDLDGSTNHYPGVGYAWYQDVMETKPGGGAWSLTDVNDAEFGLRGTT